MITWTHTQKQRLKELNASLQEQEMQFTDKDERNKAYQKIEKVLTNKNKEKLNEYYKRKRPKINILQDRLIETLTQNDFVQVTTPIILSKGHLAKMTITEEHALYKQVFWLDEKKCLRPMLAPNLYYLLKDLLRLWEKPVRIFEIGTCFRKETQGMHHLNEFTMLNLVEMGLPHETRHERLKELADIVMQAAEIKEYKLETKTSNVYGDTIDVMTEIELGSGAMGPHPLDSSWGITDTWVGIGFGLERLQMVKENTQNVQQISKSLTYQDGVRLNI
jgi:phenylalanyl-tRNA synthetase alpha chain